MPESCFLAFAGVFPFFCAQISKIHLDKVAVIEIKKYRNNCPSMKIVKLWSKVLDIKFYKGSLLDREG